MYCNIDNLQHRAHRFALKQRHVPREERYYGKELVINHLEKVREITTKTGLIRSLKYYYKNNPNFAESEYHVFDTTPTSYVVTAGILTKEFNSLVKRYANIQKNAAHKERMPQKHCTKNMWLVKPANENQGKGIKIFSDI